MAKPPMLTSEVAREYGISPTRVQQMDDELQPTRTSSGVRLFDPDVVARVFAERAKAAR